MSASAYARLVPRAHRSAKLPKIDRPMRPRMIAWAGPSAFYPNRFYEIDKWYKARIDKPEKIPQLHIIEPTDFNRTIEEVLDPRQNKEATNIGFAPRPLRVEVPRTAEERSVLEKKARKQELLIDLEKAESHDFAVFHHFKIFEHLFGDGVYFHNTQGLDVSFGDNAVYRGNIIAAEDLKCKPQVVLESVGSGGFNTLLMVNLDGNAFEGANGELAHWIVKDIPDGASLNQGVEVLPFVQPVPFMGTGYHRIVFLLFRHDAPLNFDFKLTSELHGRVLSTSQFYKTCEDQITPSAVSFCQTSYDLSCKEALHQMGLKSPIYGYEYNEALKPPQREFPHKPMPFDLYLDMYRDPKGVEQELLEERLRRASTDDYKVPKWLDPDYNTNKRNLPPWIHSRILARSGRYSALYDNVIRD